MTSHSGSAKLACRAYKWARRISSTEVLVIREDSRLNYVRVSRSVGGKLRIIASEGIPPSLVLEAFRPIFLEGVVYPVVFKSRLLKRRAKAAVVEAVILGALVAVLLPSRVGGSGAAVLAGLAALISTLAAFLQAKSLSPSGLSVDEYNELVEAHERSLEWDPLYRSVYEGLANAITGLYSLAYTVAKRKAPAGYVSLGGFLVDFKLQESTRAYRVVFKLGSLARVSGLETRVGHGALCRMV